MSTQRIRGGLSPRIGLDRTYPGEVEGPSLERRVEDSLFGGHERRLLDPDQYPEQLAQLLNLKKYRRKIAHMLGDTEDEYPLLLAEGSGVSIDAEGSIAFGAAFLEAYAGQEEVLVAFLAHHIGRRPKLWRERVFASPKRLCDTPFRDEEGRADAFMGMALAELGMSVEPAIAVIATNPDLSDPESSPPAQRAEIIREAHAGRALRVEMRRKMFPDLDRMTSPVLHLGDG